MLENHSGSLTIVGMPLIVYFLDLIDKDSTSIHVYLVETKKGPITPP